VSSYPVCSFDWPTVTLTVIVNVVSTSVILQNRAIKGKQGKTEMYVA
jgi:hypothetical protein